MVMAADLQNTQRPGVYVMVVESKPMDAGMVVVSANAIEQSLMTTGKVVIYGIYFDFDKADVKAESKQQVAEIAALMNDHVDLKLMVTGHTDNQGSADYNQHLSQLRADAIVTTLVNTYSIASNRLEAKGMGSTSPIADNDTDDGRKKNRRVELTRQ
jgi:OmpA-OmpF porin, OOP family